MKTTFALTRSFFLMLIRDKGTLFWLVAFPLVLMTMLVLIFSSFDNPKNLDLKVVLLRNPGKNIEFIEEAFKELASPKNGKQTAVKLSIKKLGDDDRVLKKEIEKVKEGQTLSLVVVPAGFDDDMGRWLQSLATRRLAKQPELKVYYRQEQAASQVSTEIVRSLIKHLNNAFALRSGVPFKDFKVTQSYVGSTKRMKYKDFIFPGLIIFAVMATSLFGITQEIVDFRSRNVLKRTHLAPVKPLQILVSFSASRLFLTVLQYLLISAFAIWVFKIGISPFEPALLKYTALSVVTFFSFSFMLASVISNIQQANIISQMSLQVMQFLGGLYFNVFQVPMFLRWFVYINPVTYLAAGVRDELGLVKTPYPMYLSYAVPLAWTVFGIVLASLFFKWVKTE